MDPVVVCFGDFLIYIRSYIRVFPKIGIPGYLKLDGENNGKSY